MAGAPHAGRLLPVQRAIAAVRCLVVMEGETLVGLLTEGDFVAARADPDGD